LGEFGIDYSRPGQRADVNIQEEAFVQQAQLGEELGLPLTLHLRHHDKDAPGDGEHMCEAEKRTLEIMKATISANARFHIHCFGDTPAFLRELLQHFSNAYVGFTGCAFFKRAINTRRALEATPLARLVLETDGPYMAVPPFRGMMIAHPGHVPVIAHHVAQIKGVPLCFVLEASTQNAEKLYGLASRAPTLSVSSYSRLPEVGTEITLKVAAVATEDSSLLESSCAGTASSANIQLSDHNIRPANVEDETCKHKPKQSEMFFEHESKQPKCKRRWGSHKRESAELVR